MDQVFTFLNGLSHSIGEELFSTNLIVSIISHLDSYLPPKAYKGEEVSNEMALPVAEM